MPSLGLERILAALHLTLDRGTFLAWGEGEGGGIKQILGGLAC